MDFVKLRVLNQKSKSFHHMTMDTNYLSDGWTPSDPHGTV